MGFRIPRRGVWAALAITALSGVAALAATATSPTRHQLLGELQRAATPARTAAVAGFGADRRAPTGVSLTMALTPNRASGPNRVWVRIARRGRPLSGARVAVVFSMPSMNMWNVYSASLAPAGAGRYVATLPVLGMAGRWRLGVAVAPPKGHRFRVAVTDRMSS
jgi:YtkA-like